MRSLRSLVRSIARPYSRAPAHAWTVTATLALGIALASATGTIARAIAFDGLPVTDVDRLVVLWGTDGSGSFTHLPISPRDVAPLAESMRSVATIAASDYNGASEWVFRTQEGDAAPLRLRGALAGGTLFDVLGTAPLIGRGLRPDDDVIGAPRVMVLSHSAWQSRFGGDPEVLGRSLHAVQRGATYTIVGVMPPGLDFPRGVDFWTAFAPTAARNGSLEQSLWAVDVVARLSPGATPAQAREALTAFYGVLATQGRTPYAGARASVRTLTALVTGDVRPAFTALAAAALVVLLATCGNVVALLLVRLGVRRRELAVRTAIGAPRRRLMGELMAEHLVLATAGGAVGAAVAVVLVRAFVALAPPGLPRAADLGVEWSLLAAVVAVTSLVTLVVGVVPAFVASRVAPAVVLGSGRRGAGGGSSDARVRRILVGAQVALALVLLVGASLVTRSLARLTALDLGLPTADQIGFVTLVTPAPGDVAVSSTADESARMARWRSTLESLLAELQAAPGIVSAAPVAATPFSGVGGWDARLTPEGAAPNDSARRPYLNLEVTNQDYLRVTGIPLLRGRWLSAADGEDAPRSIVLSERAARALFPGEDALGRRVFLWSDLVATVVGIVGDSRYRDLFEARPSVYVPYRQFDAATTTLAIRTQGDPSALASLVRDVVARSDPALLVQGRGALRALMEAPLARPRLLAAVLGVYAATIVLLAIAGLYAVVAGSVASRRQEFGVRAALGATMPQLVLLVLREGMVVAATGAAVGVLMALSATRLLASVLYDVSPTDAATLTGSAIALLAACALATLLPAWSAGRADPASALRAEGET